MKGAGALLLALVIGFAAGVFAVTGRGGSGDPVAASTRDSLSAAILRADSLDAAANRARVRAWEDSIALATIASRVRVRPIPPTSPADTVTIPDTLTVYEVPAPVAALVVRLEARVGSLAAALDTATLRAIAEKNARELAESVSRQLEGALEAERRRKWRYRMEGAGFIGAAWGIAKLFGG